MKSAIFWIAILALVDCIAVSPAEASPSCTHDHVAQMLLKTYQAADIDPGATKADLPSMSDEELSEMGRLLDELTDAHKAYLRGEDEAACAGLRKIAAEKKFVIE